jgi:hypothetical protein
MAEKNRVKRIVFLVEVPFNQRDYQRFGIATILENGFAVEVWDFGKFLHPGLYEKINSRMPDPLAWDGRRVFLRANDALGAMRSLGADCLVVCLLNYYLETYPFFLALSRARVEYAVLLATGQPAAQGQAVLRELFARLKKVTLARIPGILFNHIPYCLLRIRPADLLLAGGKETVHTQRYPLGKKTKTLLIHALDYDLYRQIKNIPAGSDKNTGVFLDEYGPFHPDYSFENMPQNYRPEEYYALLCSFFDYLEKKYGVEIAIAAHPRSAYERHPAYFGRRSVIRGKTAELVQGAGFVIAHHSTALNFAVLFEKPVIFITTDPINIDRGKYIRLMASLLGKKPVNLSRSIGIDLEKESQIDRQAYDRYRRSFIKMEGTPDLPFWQVFSGYVKNLK